MMLGETIVPKKYWRRVGLPDQLGSLCLVSEIREILNDANFGTHRLQFIASDEISIRFDTDAEAVLFRLMIDEI